MIIITNKGEVDVLAFSLMGASTKRDDISTIGYFGSGAKYAIAYLLRNDITFQVWIGDHNVEFTKKKVTLRDKEFWVIVVDEKDTSITTDMGPKWEPWTVIRELYANAIDEGGEMAITDEFNEFIKPGNTTIIIDETPFQDVIDKQDMLFCRGRDVIYQDPELKIYDMIGNGGMYVKGILVHEFVQDGYGYELLQKPYSLNEERQVKDEGKAAAVTLYAMLQVTDDKMARKIASRLHKREGISTAERFICEISSYYTSIFEGLRISDAYKRYRFKAQNEFKDTDLENTIHVPKALVDAAINLTKHEQPDWVLQADANLERTMARCIDHAREMMMRPYFLTDHWQLGVSPVENRFAQKAEGTTWINVHLVRSCDEAELTEMLILFGLGDFGHTVAEQFTKYYLLTKANGQQNDI